MGRMLQGPGPTHGATSGFASESCSRERLKCVDACELAPSSPGTCRDPSEEPLIYCHSLGTIRVKKRGEKEGRRARETRFQFLSSKGELSFDIRVFD